MSMAERTQANGNSGENDPIVTISYVLTSAAISVAVLSSQRLRWLFMQT